MKICKYWIILDHPQHIASALPIASFINKEYKVKPQLIVSKHEYWKNIDYSKYKSYFSSSHFFNRLDFPPRTMPIWKQFAASILLLFQLILQKRKVRKIPMERDDVILSFASTQFLTNLILSNHKSIKKINLLAEATYNNFLENLDFNNYSYSIGSIITTNVIQPLIGMNKTYYLVSKKAGKGSDGALLVRYEKRLEEIFDRVLVMVNIFEDAKEIKDNVRKTYYPYVFPHKTIKKKKKSDRIVFFGQPFLVAKNIPEELYVEKLNEVLTFLKDQFGENYKLYYRPHPRERKEIEIIDFKRFQIQRDGMMAELYYLKEKERIHSTYSVGSTTSRSALNFGINSYVFIDLFNFPKESLKAFKKLFGNVPKGFYITSLDKKPRPLQILKNSDKIWNIFEKDLKWALETS